MALTFSGGAAQSGNVVSPPPRPSNNLTLDKYMPLGVFVFKAESHVNNDTWTEVPLLDDLHLVGRWAAALNNLCFSEWIRMFHGSYKKEGGYVVLRVYILPDDVARRDVPRDNVRLRNQLANLLFDRIDITPAGWECMGSLPAETTLKGIRAPPIADDSLFYIFNTVKSPHPEPELISDPWTAEAAMHILQGRECEFGITTELYPYQRRSIATMVQREMQPNLRLDPRLEVQTGPTGIKFFYDRIECHILTEGAHYEEPRGGILAETMGYGKTLIVLALVAATKDQMPKTPVEHVETSVFTNEVGARSLLSMAAATAVKQNIPWRQHFKALAKEGVHFERCMKVLQTPPYYQINEDPALRPLRRAPKIQKILLCKTTLVVVPTNLFAQWRAEIQKHFANGALRTLMVSETSPSLSNVEELASNDLILIEKKRFLVGIGFRADNGSVSEDLPLKRMHFLRLVIDEGHSFAATGLHNNTVSPMTAIKAERRWVVTGTPSSVMVGVEIDQAVEETAGGTDKNTTVRQQNDILQRRRAMHQSDQHDLRRLGRIVSSLLRVQPWCNPAASGDSSSWDQYTRLGARADEGVAAAVSVRNILESVIVRHRIGEVEAELPQLHNKIVILEPTFYDKASMDLFTLVICSNAITSERTDQDYLFHPRNSKPLESLVRNLRRAPFFWTSFKKDEVDRTLEVAESYLMGNLAVPDADQDTFAVALEHIPRVLNDVLWEAMHASEEMMFSVHGLPQAISAPLGFDERSKAMTNSQQELTWDREDEAMLSASRLIAIQKFCRERAYLDDPILGLKDVVDQISSSCAQSSKMLGLNNSVEKNLPKCAPHHGLQSDVQLSVSTFAAHKKAGTIKAPPRPRKRKMRRSSPTTTHENSTDASNITITGTVSAKLSYLLSRVYGLYKEEKILIFYDGDTIAWYIAQGLEILGIAHFVYPNTMSTAMRNDYHATFMRDDSEERVMLIDLRQGGHGLNITSATRIFFVNPVWHIGTEAQAIKRAHRIGQTKEVFVETLILRDSIEHRLYERRKNMNLDERDKAKSSPLEDQGVRQLLHDFHFLLANGNGPKVAPVQLEPLVFPQLAESQRREAERAAGKANGEDEADENLAEDEVMEITGLDTDSNKNSSNGTNAVDVAASLNPAPRDSDSGAVAIKPEPTDDGTERPDEEAEERQPKKKVKKVARFAEDPVTSAPS